MKTDREKELRETKAHRDAEVLREAQAKFDEFVARLNEPGEMDRILAAAPEHGQILKLGPTL